MRAIIVGIGMDSWNAVSDGWSAPTVKNDKGEDILKPFAQWSEYEKSSASANSKALSLIFSSINENQFKRIQNCESAKEAWDKPAIAYEGTSSVKRSRLDMLATKFENLTMGESESVEEFSGRLSSIASEAHILGKRYKDKKLVKKLLMCLPTKFESKRTALATSQNTDLLSFEEVVGMLQAHEMEILGNKSQLSRGTAAFTANTSSSSQESRMSNIEESVGFLAKNFKSVMKKIERGGYSKGAERMTNQAGTERTGNKTDIKCHECKGVGHFKTDCPTWKRKESMKCYECKGLGHTKNECPNITRKEKSYIAENHSSSSESDTEDEQTGFVAFIGSITEQEAEDSDNDESEEEEETKKEEEVELSLEEQFKKLFISWTSMRKENDEVKDQNLEYLIKIEKLSKQLEHEKETNGGLDSAFEDMACQRTRLLQNSRK